MLKPFAVALMMTLAIAPATFAQTTESPGSTSSSPASSRSVTGQIESINEADRLVTIRTTDGATRTYQYQKGVLPDSKLSQGSTVLVSPLTYYTGTVVDQFRNFIRVRPDEGYNALKERVIYVEPPVPYGYGDRVIVSDEVVDRVGNNVDGYLAKGNIVQYTVTEVPALTTSSTSSRVQLTPVERPAPVEPAVAPVAEPVSEPAPAQTSPVRALW